MKRKLCILMLFVIVVQTFVACSNGDDSSDMANTTAFESTEVTTAEPEDALEARAKVSDELPEKNFGGEEFNMVSQTWTLTDAWAEDETGDVIEDAVYSRNRAIEERFNVVMTIKNDIYSANNTYVRQVVLSGEDVVDLHFAQGYWSCPLVFDELMMNWYDIPYVDFEKEWWADSTIDTLTYNGKCYDAIGDVCLSAMYAAYCVFYDKVMAESYGLDDLYTVVSDGKWTIDYLAETVRGIYSDVDGDGQRGFDDYYGFSSDIRTNIDSFQWAFDNPVITKGNDGSPQYVYHTEKLSAIVEKLRDLTYNNNGTYITKDYVSPEYNSSEGLSRDMFVAGNALMANGYISMAVTHFRDNKNDYGIIPQPKWDEAQETYHSFVDGYHQLLQVPVTVQNTELVGIITEAMCAESWKTVVPAYYDIALKVKGARDVQSIEMLDLIVNGRYFDFGYIFNSSKGAPGLQKLIQDTTLEFESFYASKEETIIAFYEGVFEQYK